MLSRDTIKSWKGLEGLSFPQVMNAKTQKFTVLKEAKLTTSITNQDNGIFSLCVSFGAGSESSIWEEAWNRLLVYWYRSMLSIVCMYFPVNVILQFLKLVNPGVSGDC